MLSVPLYSFLTKRDNDNLICKIWKIKGTRLLYPSDLKQMQGRVRRWLLNNQTHWSSNLTFINHRQQNTKGEKRQIVRNSPLCLWNWNTSSHFRSIPSDRRESGYPLIFPVSFWAATIYPVFGSTTEIQLHIYSITKWVVPTLCPLSQRLISIFLMYKVRTIIFLFKDTFMRILFSDPFDCKLMLLYLHKMAFQIIKITLKSTKYLS